MGDTRYLVCLQAVSADSPGLDVLQTVMADTGEVGRHAQRLIAAPEKISEADLISYGKLR